jgi:hypothetical protein
VPLEQAKILPWLALYPGAKPMVEQQTGHKYLNMIINILNQIIQLLVVYKQST